MPTPPPELSVVIPTFNGAERIGPTLEALLRSKPASRHSVEIIVVDNGSQDRTSEVVKGFEGIQLRRVEPNRGFSGGVAAGVELAKGRILAVVSDDVIVDETFFTILPRYFDREETFAVMPRPLGSDDEVMFHPVVPFMRRAKIKYHLFRDVAAVDHMATRDPVTTFFVMGGLALYDRERFEALGGFSDLYLPFFCEDTHVAWQAWSRGWRCYYEPTSQVRHHQKKGAVESNYSSAYRYRLLQRNELLLNLVHNDMHPFLQIVLFVWELIRRLARPIKRRPVVFGSALVGALGRLGHALELRERERRERTHDNRRALRLLRRPWGALVDVRDA